MSETPDVSEQSQIEETKERILSDPRAAAMEMLLLKKQNYEFGHDYLTGLPNRSILMYQTPNFIATADRHGEQVLALFFDLDKLKVTNDNEGHEAGDRLLKKLADQLRANFRKSDLVARYAPLPIERADAMATAIPLSSTKLPLTLVAPATPLTTPNAAPRPSLTP